MQKTLDEKIDWLKGFSKEVVVASTMHEPNQSLMPSIKRITPVLKDIGLQWHISITDATRRSGKLAREF